MLTSPDAAQPVEWKGVEHRFPFRYPQEIEEWVSLRSGQRVILRPIRPGDECAYKQMFTQLDPDDVRFRFFNYLKELPRTEIKRFVDINYDKDINVIANGLNRGGCPEMLGVIGAFLDVEQSSVEFAMIIRSDLKRQGLGKILLGRLVEYCSRRRFRQVIGQVMAVNKPMLGLTASLGFKHIYEPDEEDVTVWLKLR
jgi:acetyltransferase